MTYIILLLILCCNIVNTCVTYSENELTTQPGVYTNGSAMPIPEYVQKSIHYNDMLDGVHTRVFVTCDISSDGKITDFCTKSNCPQCDEEIKRILCNIDSICPGLINDKAVNTRLQFNISITLK